MKVARTVAKIGTSREKGVLPFSAASACFFAVGASVLLSLSSSAKYAALHQWKRPQQGAARSEKRSLVGHLDQRRERSLAGLSTDAAGLDAAGASPPVSLSLI